MSRSSSLASLRLLALLALALAGCASGGPRALNPDGSLPLRDANLDGESPVDAGEPFDAGAPLDAEPPKDLGVDVDLGLCDDADGDGFPRGSGCALPRDCDDTHAAVYPGATEICNALDDDCDGSIDEGFGGTVSCGVGACLRNAPQCDAGRTDTCAPGTPTAETCNSIDDDCDGSIDEDFGAATTCGVGACARTVSTCAGGTPGSCTPGTPTAETCNGIDDDCDSATDEGLPALVCGVGACERTVAACSGGAPQTCVPGSSVAELCNGADDDCDGAIDEGLPALTCGTGACARSAVACVGGVAQPCSPGSPGVETCNRVDDDCDGLVDEELGNTSCGVGACARSVAACVGGSLGTCTPGGAVAELCNGIDDDCNGVVDNGVCGTAAPSNDTCTGALLLTGAGGTRTTDTLVGATANTTDCGAGGVEVFYRVDVTVASLIYLDTFGTGFDTTLSYRGMTCPGTAIICEDDDCSTAQDQLVTVAAPGTHYFAVHAFSGSVTPGALSLRWQVMSAAGGSNTRITGAGSYSGTTSGASAIGASCGGSAGSAENSYYWTQCLASAHSITADMCTASYDTVLHLRGPTGELACNDDDSSGTCAGSYQSSLAGISTAGVGLFQLVADGFYTSSTGTYTLSVTSL
jgi:hypothetical protein